MTDTPEPSQANQDTRDPLAEATGTTDPKMQQWLLGQSYMVDGRLGLPDMTAEGWAAAYAALLRAGRDSAPLDAARLTQFLTLHGHAMDRFRDARAAAGRPAELARAVQLGTRLLATANSLSRTFGRSPCQPVARPLDVRWAGDAPGRPRDDRPRDPDAADPFDLTSGSDDGHGRP